MAARLDLTGMRFGRLTAVSSFKVTAKTTWVCECDCGKSTTVTCGDLRAGKTKSCGCLKEDIQALWTPRHTQHRLSGIPEYSVWRQALRRCSNGKDKAFRNYGGRGISMCAEWANNFTVFLADMGPRPAGMTLERRDNNRGYDPGNCEWADRRTQGNNKRSNKHITHDGKTLTLREWADLLGINYSTLRSRVSSGKNNASKILERAAGVSL